MIFLQGPHGLTNNVKSILLSKTLIGEFMIDDRPSAAQSRRFAGNVANDAIIAGKLLINISSFNPLTRREKLCVIPSFLTFDSTHRTLKCDHSLESC